MGGGLLQLLLSRLNFCNNILRAVRLGKPQTLLSLTLTDVSAVDNKQVSKDDIT